MDSRIFTMDGEQVSDYDSAYAQQRVDIDTFNTEQQQQQEQYQSTTTQSMVSYDQNYDEELSMTGKNKNRTLYIKFLLFIYHYL